MNWPRFTVLAGLVLFAAATRLLPHPNNVTALGGLAIFAGAMFRDPRLALGLPLAALVLSDLVIGTHVLLPVVYGSFAVSVLLGRWLATSRTVPGVAGATLLGAVQFYLVTNFANWVVYDPPTVEGLVACYVSALPFFRNSLAGDFGFVATLFGLVYVAEAVAPALRERGSLSPVA